MPNLVDSLLAYFEIPPGFGPDDGLSWHPDGDSMELKSGGSFFFLPQLQSFLDGLLHIRPLVHFAFVIDSLHQLGLGDRVVVGMPVYQVERLRKAFKQSGSNLRNAGVFFGHLLDSIVPTTIYGIPQRPGALLDLLKHLPAYTKTRSKEAFRLTPDAPPLSVERFREIVAERLLRYSDAEIRHWLRFGAAPIFDDTSKKVADAIQVPDRDSICDWLRELTEENSRLQQTRWLVPRFESVLTLPNRKRFTEDPPQGGYADTTTRGQPEHLLPSQFALPEDEFVRRFAQHELLFFQREQPKNKETEELILILDQGVRTWGEIRQALLSAMIVYTQLANKRQRPVQLVFSSNYNQRIDPKTVTNEEITPLLESVSFESTPAATIRHLGLHLNNQDRDIILLTHPRCLRDEALQFELGLYPETNRIFALTVSDQGEGEFCKLHQGRVQNAKPFRINLSTPTIAVPKSVSKQWEGALEPIPWPFYIGMRGSVVQVELESTGTHVMVLCGNDFLGCWELESGRGGPIPRPFTYEKLHRIRQIRGTRGGFVLFSSAISHHYLHFYDLQQRRVHSIEISHLLEYHRPKLYVFNELHVALVSVDTELNGVIWDWQAGECVRVEFMIKNDLTPSVNLQRAIDLIKARQKNVKVSEHPYQVLQNNFDSERFSADINLLRTDILFDSKKGLIKWPADLDMKDTEKRWVEFVPTEDNQPILQKVQLDLTLKANDTLILFARHSRTYFIDMQGPSFLGQVPAARDILSVTEDGSRFACEFDVQRVRVYDLPGHVQLLFDVPVGKTHTNIYFCLDVDLLIQIGQQLHRLSWRNGPLQHLLTVGSLPDHHDVNRPTKVLPSYITEHERNRFDWCLRAGLDFLLDSFGQMVIYDPKRSQIVAMIAIWKKQLNIWLPDGSFYGNPDHVEGKQQPDVLERLANRLRDGIR